MGLVDHRGRALAPGAEIGAGGEGAVFSLPAGLVAKLYRAAPPPAKVDKLAAMLRWQPPRAGRISAWPRATVHPAPGAPPVGVVMRRVTGERLDFLINSAERKALHPDLDWGFLVALAANLAAALDEVHADGIVIGDLNPEGVLVDPVSGRVALIDMDSVQFAADGRRFTCDVGKPSYTAPELLRLGSVAGVWRDPASDRFALAVIIFEILFLGRHPFIARPLAASGEMPDAASAIATGGYAYGRERERFGWRLPEHWPTPDLLPPPLQQLFEDAFAGDPARRPDAGAWHRGLLHGLLPRLTRCANDRRHVHSVTACPWCAFERHGRAFFEPSPDARVSTDAIDLTALDAVVAGLAEQVRPQLELAAGLIPPDAPPPPARWASLRLPQYVGLWLVVAAAGIIALVAGAWPFGPLLSGIGGLGLVGPRLWRAIRRELADQRLRRARTAVDLAWEGWPAGERVLAAEAHGWHRAYAATRAASGELARRSVEALAVIHSTALYRHLEQRGLRTARFDGIAADDLAALAQHGLTSAADLTPGSLHGIRGIGPRKSSVLMAWRRECEAAFTFDPEAPRVRAALQAQFGELKQEVQDSLVLLRRFTAALRRIEPGTALAERAAAMAPLARALVQAQADRQAVEVG